MRSGWACTRSPTGSRKSRKGSSRRAQPPPGSGSSARGGRRRHTMRAPLAVRTGSERSRAARSASRGGRRRTPLSGLSFLLRTSQPLRPPRHRLSIYNVQEHTLRVCKGSRACRFESNAKCRSAVLHRRQTNRTAVIHFMWTCRTVDICFTYKSTPHNGLGFASRHTRHCAIVCIHIADMLSLKFQLM